MFEPHDNVVTPRLELDLMQQSELARGFELTVKYRLPSVVVHPQLVGQALMQRTAKQGRFKILIPIDWQRGDNYGPFKFADLPVGALNADGFEILITGGKTASENIAEVAQLVDFVTKRIQPTCDIRFVLGCLDRPQAEVLHIVDAVTKARPVRMIRIDHRTKGQINKFSLKAHEALLNEIMTRSSIAQVKISGNVDSIKYPLRLKAQRFGVSLPQFDKLVRELPKLEEHLKEEDAAADA